MYVATTEQSRKQELQNSATLLQKTYIS